MQAAKDRSKRMGKNEVRMGRGTGQGSALETLGLEEFQAGVGGGQALLCSGLLQQPQPPCYDTHLGAAEPAGPQDGAD